MAIENVRMNAINLFNDHPSGYIRFTKCNMRGSSKSKLIVLIIIHPKCCVYTNYTIKNKLITFYSELGND